MEYIYKHKHILLPYFSNQKYKILKEKFSQLNSTRKAIQNLTLDFPKTYSKYTQSIAFLLLEISEISNKVKNKQLSDTLYNYSTLLMYKESLGQKRAALSALFVKKDFAKEIFEYFLTSDTQEKIYSQIFLRTVDEKTKIFYKNILNHRIVKKVLDYENLAKKKLAGSNIEVDPQKWFDTITKKIKLIQKVEDKLFFNIMQIYNRINQEKNLTFTQEEKEWLKENQFIKIAVMDYWVHDKNGNNLHTDLLKLLNNYGHIHLTPVEFSKWKDGYNEAINGKAIYGIMNLSWSKEREKLFNYSPVYNYSLNYLIVREDEQNIHSLKDLEDTTIYLKEKAITHKIIDNLHKNIKVINLSTDKEMYKSLAENKNIKAFISFVPDEIQLKKYHLKVAKVIYDKTGEIYIGMSKSHPLLVDILKKIYKKIPQSEITKLQNKNYSTENTFLSTLTTKEYEWLLNYKRPIHYVYDIGWAPFEWTNGLGKHTGIIADILKIISEKTSIEFIPVHTKNWKEAVLKMENREADMYSAVVKNKKREQYANFSTKSIYSTPGVIVSRKDDETVYVNIKQALEEKKVGVVEGNSLYDYLKVTFPHLTFYTMETTQDGFEHLTQGDIDVFISNAATALYFIKQKGYLNTRIATKIDFNFDLKIALQKDMPKELLSILDKAISSISEKTLGDIYYKWTNVSVRTKMDWTLFIQIGGFVIIIILFILWNNKKLKVKVKEKTQDLQNVLESLEITVKERTKALEISKKEIEAIHKHTKESIEYASLIQGALIPKENTLLTYFKDHFVTWIPKDTVGGDIWLFDELRHKDECLLFFIDCTGHGVPGAFVTMIVKSIEREIITKLKKQPQIDISPAIIMGYFNKTMKILLRQETEDSVSNAGFDGGIIYYNKQTQILKFSGAETPLFYIDQNGDFQTIKGNRYSVGYKKCAMNYKYRETTLEVKKGMKFFCTTDGYLDQNGGEKDFPFGKKRFGNIIKENYTKSMQELQNIFHIEMKKYESQVKNNDRNDDMTIIGFEIG